MIGRTGCEPGAAGSLQLVRASDEEGRPEAHKTIFGKLQDGIRQATGQYSAGHRTVLGRPQVSTHQVCGENNQDFRNTMM